MEEATHRRPGRPAKKNRSAGAGLNNSLVRSLQILERLADSTNGMTLSELSLQLGIAPATIHRLLYTFEQSGYVYQDSDLGAWFVGVKAFSVGSSFVNRRNLVTIARPYMFELMRSSGETVNLAIEDAGEVVFINQVECDEMMRMIVNLGSRAPIHASGAGKALLATMPDAEVQKILRKHGLQRFTEKTIHTVSRLKSEMAVIKARQYSVDDEEHARGLRCVAATIHDEAAIGCAAISISGPVARIDDQRLDVLGASVREMARKITRAFGGVLPEKDK